MKTKIIFLAAFIILTANIIIFAGPAKVFCVNLYAENFDFRLGEESKPVISFNGLKPYTPTRMLSSNNFGDHKFYFKLSTEKTFYFWALDGKNAEICPVEADKTYCFVIGVDGSIEYYILDEKKDNNPKVCFLNGSNSTITRMEIGKEFKTDYAAYMEDIKENGISTFVSVKPDNYNCFWQFPEQVKSKEWYYYPDATGKKAEIFSFKNGNYFLFLAYTQGRDDYAMLWNITP